MNLAEAINQGQVAVTIKTSHLLGTKRDQVEIIDIAQGCGGITKDSHGIGKDLITTLRDVSTSKECIMNNDATGIKLIPYS